MYTNLCYTIIYNTNDRVKNVRLVCKCSYGKGSYTPLINIVLIEIFFIIVLNDLGSCSGRDANELNAKYGAALGPALAPLAAVAACLVSTSLEKRLN